MKIRRAQDRGIADFGWLNSRHSFSFGDYYDLDHMGFGPLRVINQDLVAPGAGFGTHGHANMEIISYVLKGALEHKDSIGTGSIIVPGEVQRMSAGSGIRHSEYNHSKTDSVEFLQIWIVPEQNGIKPGYEQKAFKGETVAGIFQLVGSRDGREGSVTIHQDVNMYAAHLTGAEATLTLAEGRSSWVQVISGTLVLNGESLGAGDGAALDDPRLLQFSQAEKAHVLVFDMKM